MQSTKIEGNYRILLDGEHLPEEVEQEELDSVLSTLKAAIQSASQVLEETYRHGGCISGIIREAVEKACWEDRNEFRWRIRSLLEELNQVQEQLRAGEDDVASYEDSEMLTDAGFTTSWYRPDLFEKVDEDSEEQEVIEEIFMHSGKPVYRKRTTVWETIPGGRHSKEINYEDLPIDENTARLIRNTFRKVPETGFKEKK